MTGINTAPSESVNEEKICKVKSDYENLLLFFYFQMKHDIWSNKQKQTKFFFFFKPKRYPSDNSKGGHPNPPKYILHTY